MLSILNTLHILNKVNIVGMGAARAAVEVKKSMTRKDKLMTEEKVVAECEKVLEEGTPLHAINANMIIDSLNTKGRSTVYKYVAVWQARRLEQATVVPFTLPADAGAKLQAVFAGMIGEVVLGDRQAAADQVAAANNETAAMREAMAALVTTLESTEKERDDALQLVDELDGKLLEAIVVAQAKHEIAEAAKAERDEVIGKYLPWLHANTPPGAN